MAHEEGKHRFFHLADGSVQDPNGGQVDSKVSALQVCNPLRKWLGFMGGIGLGNSRHGKKQDDTVVI